MTPIQAISRAVMLTAPAKTSTGKKDCTFCKPAGYKFLPLRYAVVCGVGDAQASMWPTLSYPLGEGVTTQKLVASRYTVRLLREGFLYVLVSRNTGEPQWQAYSVTAGGLLAAFPIGLPPVVPPVFTCDLATDGVGASLVAIEKIETVKTIYLLFSPDVLPVEVLDQRAQDKLGMQGLPPHNWRGQTHLLAAQDLGRWVAEFKLNTDGMSVISIDDPKLQGQALLESQLYPLVGGPGERKPDFARHLKRLTALAAQLQQMQSPACVLWDPIGITQELNFYHRSLDVALQKMIQPHEWELQTSQRILGLKQRVMSQAAVTPAAFLQNPDQAEYGSVNPAYTAWLRDPASWVKQNQQTAWEVYAACYDESKRLAQTTALDAKLTPLFAQGESRFADLQSWLTSTALRDAFEQYNQDSIECGLLFDYQIALCTYGLATSQGGNALLGEWVKDLKVGTSNWLVRQMLFNQKVALDEFRTATGQLQGKADIDTSTLQSMVSNISGVMDKANAIAQLAAGGVLPKLAAGVPAKLLTSALFVSTIGQQAFGGGSGAVDKLYAFLIYLRGGARAYMQGMADAVVGIFDTSYASQASVPLDESQSERVALKQAMTANTSEFEALRFGTGLALIEAWNLSLKYRAAYDKAPSSRAAWDLYAACASTSAAIAVSVANLSKIVRSGSAWIEHLTLTSGMLGGFAAGVVAGESVTDAAQAFQARRRFAAYMFASKAALNAIASAGSLYVGVLYSGPLLQLIGSILGEKWLGERATQLGTYISEKALSEVMMFGIETTLRAAAEVVVAFIGCALILEQVGELVILQLSDNPMQIWLTRCSFRKAPDAYHGLWGTVVHDKNAGKPYASLDEEITAFDTALQGGV